MSGILERAIENWLISTNERNYQLAFCQVLLNEGHEIKHISSHGQLEEGKDIITIYNGEYHAYQLKTGNINLPQWHKIYGEIQDLTHYKIELPSINTDKIHKSFLVTNGKIGNEPKQRIRKLNEDNLKKGYSYLDIIEFDSLLSKFIECQGKFVPKQLKDFQTFLELFLTDGTDFLPKEKFSNFLFHVLFKDIPQLKSNALNSLSSSLILVSYSLNSFQRKENYFALFEAWTILIANILRYSEKLKKKNSGKKWPQSILEKNIDNSLKLIMHEIDETLILFKHEIMNKNSFIEGNALLENEIMYKSRITLSLGTIAAFEVYKFNKYDDFETDNDFLCFVEKNLDKLLFWGESAFPYYFNIIHYLEISDRKELAKGIIEKIILKIITENDSRSSKGIPSPYNDINQVMNDILSDHLENDLKNEIQNQYIDNLRQTKIDPNNDMRDFRNELDKIEFKKYFINSLVDNFVDSLRSNKVKYFLESSYMLKSLILMLARRDQKDFLIDKWSDISYIRFEEFKPDNDEDIFSYHVKNGINISQSPNKTQYWSKLKKEADIFAESNLYKKNIDFLRFLILVYPHRATPEIVGLLDMIN